MRKGLSAPSMLMAELPHSPSHVRRPNPYDEILQHLQSVAPALFADRLSTRGDGDPGGAACARIRLLDAVHRDAVLPRGQGTVAARDLRGLGQLRREIAAARRSGRPEAVHPGVCERAPTVDVIPGGVLPAPRSLPRGGRPAAVSV